MSKYRQLHKVFFAEGNINVSDFIKSGIVPKEIYASKNWIEKNADLIGEFDIVEIKPDEIKKISALKNPSEVYALFDMPKSPEFTHDKNELTLVLDDIKDPGNLGTIIRTADWFGVKNIICSPETVDMFNPKVVQATMGSLSRINIYYKPLGEFLSAFKSENIYGAVLNGEKLPIDASERKGFLIIGSEAKGISSEVLQFVNKPITIASSQSGGAESLNASIATAILLYAFSA